jgi:hypothetical protein
VNQPREGHVCLYVAGDDVPRVLHGMLASAGPEREIASHNVRVTDVAVRAFVDAAVFEPPADATPEVPTPSRRIR